MIAVIADDFTGAAEIGGIGVRHGLKVVIEKEPAQRLPTDLLVIATDTRALPADQAAEHIRRITRQLMELQPDFIFKKLDSVLRGNVIVEIEAQMQASGKTRAVIAAANPVLNRTIRNGVYYIDQVPVNETYFSADLHFPITSASVLEIIQPKDKSMVINLKSGDLLPDQGIVVGDVTCPDDLDQWAQKRDEHTLLAGASGFFNALLNRRKVLPENHTKEEALAVALGGKSLFVLGSTFTKNGSFYQRLNGHYLSNMPREIYYNQHRDDHLLDQWVKEIARAFQDHQKVLVTIHHIPSDEPGLPARLEATMGTLIQAVIKQIDLQELLIEGGSTASAILEHLGIKKLWPVQELGTGVIRMKPDEGTSYYITTKPGSYQWPEEVWRLNMLNG